MFDLFQNKLFEKHTKMQAMGKKDHMLFSNVVGMGQCLSQLEPKTPTRKDVVEQKNETPKMKHLMPNSPRMLMEQ